MNDENSSNSFDITPLVEEMQKLNQGTSANGEKLDSLTEYLIAKDKFNDEQRSLANETAASKDQENEIKAEARDAADQEQAETYTELLTDIRDQTVLTNNLMSGQIFFMGVIFGILFLNILWERFIR